jgi:O-antigen/teichoic acid export membrane protein
LSNGELGNYDRMRRRTLGTSSPGIRMLAGVARWAVARAPNTRLGGAVAPEEEGSSETLSVQANAVALYLTLVVSAGLGYLAWLVAARLMPPSAVGLAAAVVSASLLCSNFAILGLGISVISFLPRERRDPDALLNGFMTIVVIGGCICAAAFIVVAATFLERLHVLGSDIPLGLCFVGLATATTVLLLLDGASIAVRRADFCVVRSFVAGVVKLLALPIVWAASTLTATAIVFAWFISTAAACVLGLQEMRRIFPTYRYRPRISSQWTKVAIWNGLPNHALNLARLAPGLVIPIIVTESLSPAKNAYWYAAWTIAFLARFIPVATAQAVFAELTNRSASFTRGSWRNLWSSFLVSLVPVTIVIVFAYPILLLMGHRYAVEGALPLRLLALGVLPQALVEFYIVARRVAVRLTEPNIVLGLSAVASVLAAAYGAHVGGLVGVATGWLAVETAAGVWAAARLARGIRRGGT